jgi:hypothetical protein
LQVKSVSEPQRGGRGIERVKRMNDSLKKQIDELTREMNLEIEHVKAKYQRKFEALISEYVLNNEELIQSVEIKKG